MVQIYQYTESGEHAMNEDVAYVGTHPADPGCRLCVVADGEGGSTGGRWAAELAVRTAVEQMIGYSPQELAVPSTWGMILFEVDRAVHNPEGSGRTTLVCLAVYRDFVMGTSCGDSAALVVADGEDYVLTMNQQRYPIGSGQAIDEPFSYGLPSGWKILVMTDGVWKYVGMPNVIAAAGVLGGDALIKKLADIARLPGSGKMQDDFTVVLMEND